MGAEDKQVDFGQMRLQLDDRIVGLRDLLDEPRQLERLPEGFLALGFDPERPFSATIHPSFKEFVDWAQGTPHGGVARFVEHRLADGLQDADRYAHHYVRRQQLEEERIAALARELDGRSASERPSDEQFRRMRELQLCGTALLFEHAGFSGRSHLAAAPFPHLAWAGFDNITSSIIQFPGTGLFCYDRPLWQLGQRPLFGFYTSFWRQFTLRVSFVGSVNDMISSYFIHHAFV
jgi:hypothetical protein